MSKATQTVDLNHLIGFITAHLPVGWELRLCMRHGDTWFSLLDIDDELIYFSPDRSTAHEVMVDYMNHAREEEGMEAVEYGESEE